jgi:putative endopeptidase
MNKPVNTALLLCWFFFGIIACDSTPKKTGGIDTSLMDTEVRPQDDFYNFVNGTWMKNTEIPNDKTRWGSFN